MMDLMTEGISSLGSPFQVLLLASRCQTRSVDSEEISNA
jgi:hypothetical protein